MPAMRFLASLFALVAVLALIADATPALNGTGVYKATTLVGHWELLAPASLAAAHSALAKATAPWVWDKGVMSVLGLQTTLFFGALALVCGYFGRRREEMKLHIN